MDDIPMLTVAELENFADMAKRADARWAGWPAALFRVCRQALAQTAEIEALVGLTGAETDELLSRWDQTAPHIQRGIVARFANLCQTRERETERLRCVLSGILEQTTGELRRPDCPNFLVLSTIDNDVRAALKQEATG